MQGALRDEIDDGGAAWSSSGHFPNAINLHLQRLPLMVKQ